MANSKKRRKREQWCQKHSNHLLSPSIRLVPGKVYISYDSDVNDQVMRMNKNYYLVPGIMADVAVGANTGTSSLRTLGT